MYTSEMPVSYTYNYHHCSNEYNNNNNNNKSLDGAALGLMSNNVMP